MELRKQEKIQQKKHEEEVQRLKNLNAIAREFNTKRYSSRSPLTIKKYKGMRKLVLLL